MLVQTKKYELSKELYIKKAFTNVLKKQWWVSLIYAAINCGTLLAPSWWWFIGATIALVVYLLFWLIQFAGITQHEQGKMLFDKLAYEITSQQILIKVNSKQGMPIRWEQIQKVQKNKVGFDFWLSPVQLIHLPFKIFKSETQIKFVDTLLNRKNLVK